MERTCEKCGDLVEPEGEIGKYYWFCDTCGDYAQGVDSVLANMDELYGLMDNVKNIAKEGKVEDLRS